MVDRQEHIFPEMIPPPRGLENLRQRLEKEPESRRMRWNRPVLALTGAVILICLVLWPITGWIVRRSQQDFTTRILASLKNDANPAMFRLGLADIPFETLSVPMELRNSVAVQRVIVSDPNVIYYRIDIIGRTNTEETSRTSTD
jgi:hypothetical protein